MKLLTRISLIGLTILLLSSCAKIYYSPDAKDLAYRQKTIAIIPPVISIAARKKVDYDAMKEQQKTESLNFQNEIYSWMLKRKMQGQVSKEIQEIQTTNAKLMKAGYPDNPLTTAELCEVLGVDGIMTSSFGLSKPLSEGAAIAIGVLSGAWASTNEVRATISISDCNNQKLIWNYEHKLSGSVGSSPSRIVDQLMRKASKKMPYTIK